jgi:hypothetical protein
MVMVFPNRKIVERLQQEFPFGCRVVLDQMDDLQAPPIGTQGVCRGVDDTGSVLVSWDTGSSLNVVYGADRCHRVASEAEIKESLDWMGKGRHKPTHCPRCGAVEEQNNRLLALSRRADITICEACGVFESLEDFGLLERKELADWAIVKKCWTE